MNIAEDFNNLLIDTEANLLKNRKDKDLLIKESFFLWYVQVEGINCESFEPDDIMRMLIRNVGLYREFYQDDPDYNFILGWMAGVAFWYFTPLIEEEDSILLLNKAYRSNSKNSLFKWAIRSELGLSKNEVGNLKNDIILWYDQFYDHGEVIKSYFLDIVNAS